jgi:large subunit ribosomal protein L13
VSGRPFRADIFTMKTYSPKPEHIEHRWFVMDASGQVLGRLATEIAVLLRGKHKPIFAPHMDTGDHVVVINADKVELTGNKERDKIAYRHSGYPGGIKGVRYGDFLAMRPVAAVEKAVRGMLPKNRLGRQMIKKLHVVAGGEHPHSAQKPVALAVGERPAWEGLPKPAVRSDRTGPSPSKPKAERAASPARKPSSTRSAPAAKKTTAKKTTATKNTAGKTTAKKTTAKTAAKKTSAKKTTAKTAAKKTSAKKTTAKKTTAKKGEE